MLTLRNQRELVIWGLRKGMNNFAVLVDVTQRE
jgi:hypothetical protein